jgi:hypothetical protein
MKEERKGDEKLFMKQDFIKRESGAWRKLLGSELKGSHYRVALQPVQSFMNVVK